MSPSSPAGHREGGLLLPRPVGRPDAVMASADQAALKVEAANLLKRNSLDRISVQHAERYGDELAVSFANGRASFFAVLERGTLVSLAVREVFGQPSGK